MAMVYATDILTAFYASNVANDANYEFAGSGNFGIPTPSSGNATDMHKLLTFIEVLRSLIAETTSTDQLKDIHEVLRKMMACMKFGGSSGYTAANFATNAQAAALHYIAKNPTHGGASI
jgi:hypothetical protein